MASASAYDEFEDAGMAFTADQVGAYQVATAIEERIAVLCRELHVVTRRMALPGTEKPVWHQHAQRALVTSITWLLRVGSLPGKSEDELTALPAPTTAAGKALTKEAQTMEPVDWCAAMLSDAENELVQAVTLGRRAQSAQSWPKAQRSLSNKYANALNGQRRAFETLRTELETGKQANG